MDIEKQVLAKIQAPPMEHHVTKDGPPLYIHRIVRYFVKALDFLPVFRDARGHLGKSEDYKVFHFESHCRPQIAALLNSTLFYWFWRTHGDGFHCGYNDVFGTPFNVLADAGQREALAVLLSRLMTDLNRRSALKQVKTKAGHITYQEFHPAAAKTIVDSIDRILAQHYGFSAEELDFIINYDIKYRMGGADGEEEE